MTRAVAVANVYHPDGHHIRLGKGPVYLDTEFDVSGQLRVKATDLYIAASPIAVKKKDRIVVELWDPCERQRFAICRLNPTKVSPGQTITFGSLGVMIYPIPGTTREDC